MCSLSPQVSLPRPRLTRHSSSRAGRAMMIISFFTSWVTKATSELSDRSWACGEQHITLCPSRELLIYICQSSVAVIRQQSHDGVRPGNDLSSLKDAKLHTAFPFQLTPFIMEELFQRLYLHYITFKLYLIWCGLFFFCNENRINDFFNFTFHTMLKSRQWPTATPIFRLCIQLEFQLLLFIITENLNFVFSQFHFINPA